MPLVFSWLPIEATETPATMRAAESRTAKLRQARLNRLRLADRVVSTPWRGLARLCRGSGLLKDILVGAVTLKTGGGRGIRTHEALLLTGFQDQLHRPLGQTSVVKSSRVTC